MKLDWKERHISECRGVLSNGDVQNIEKKSAFVKLDENRSYQLDVLSLDELNFLKIIGNGGYGEVIAAVHIATGKRVAVKKISKK